MKLWQFLVLLAVVAGGFGFVFLSLQGDGTGAYAPVVQKVPFTQGFYAGTTRQLSVDNAGNLTTSGTVTLNGETTLGNCATATWNPGSLASSSIDGINETSTDIALSGSALGDVCFGSLTSATSTSAVFLCNISGTATGTLTLLNTGTGALDLVTGTAKVCYFD